VFAKYKILHQLSLPAIVETFRRERVLSTETFLNKTQQLAPFVQLKLIANNCNLRFVPHELKRGIRKNRVAHNVKAWRWAGIL